MINQKRQEKWEKREYYQWYIERINNKPAHITVNVNGLDIAHMQTHITIHLTIEQCALNECIKKIRAEVNM